MTEPRTEVLLLPGGSVALEVSGDGPTLVLLHANPGCARDFDAVAPALAEQHRVVALDWPGYGASPAPDPTTFRGALSYADLLVEALDELATRPGWGPFVLIGNSVGGFAALRAAAARPWLVAGLVLVAPGGFTARTPLTVLGCRALGRPGVSRRLTAPLARLYLRRRTPETRRAIAAAGAAQRDAATNAVHATVWRSFLDPDHDLRRAPAPAAPVLLTWGRWDPVLLAALDGRRAAHSLGVTLRTFATGHEPFAERPDPWLAVVLPFLGDRRDGDAWRVPVPAGAMAEGTGVAVDDARGVGTADGIAAGVAVGMAVGMAGGGTAVGQDGG